MKQVKNISAIIVFIGLVGTLIFFIWKTFQQKKAYDDLSEAHSIELTVREKGFNNYINRMGDTIRGMRSMVMTQKQAIEEGLIREQKLRNNYITTLIAYTKLQEEFKLLNTQGNFVDTPNIIHISDLADIDNWLETDTGIYMQLPASIRFSDGKWYDLTVTIPSYNVPVIDSLKVISEPEITVGFKREPGFWGYFKEKQPVVFYENMNPYVYVNSLSNIQIKDKKKFYETTWFKIGAGFICGSAGTFVLLSQ